MATRCGISAVFLLLAGALAAPAADLPEQLQMDLEKAKRAHEEACNSAEKQLLKALEGEPELIRKQPGLKAEAKQAAIEAVEAERAAFEKHGTLPFSPRMRAAAMSYVKSLNQAARPAAMAYDKAIEHFQSPKVKDDASAAAMVAEKKVLEPRVLGVWKVTRTGTTDTWVWTLYSDGAANKASSTWVLDKTNLVITNRAKQAPPGGWVDTCQIDATGQQFAVKDKGKTVQTATLSNAPK